MQLSQDVYLWLVHSAIIPNVGQQDEKGAVSLPSSIVPSFENGYLIANITKSVLSNQRKAVPQSLANIKADLTESSKVANWNFIWLAFDEIGLKIDNRVKDLILQGEHAFIAEVVKQLYEREQHKQQNNKAIKIRQLLKEKTSHQVDIKKLNLSKDSNDADNSLEFLILLLSSSLDMGVEQILGLFTNHNKYLAQIIVKGVNGSFDPIILFYSLLVKNSAKLRQLYQDSASDAESCLSAVKPGLISQIEQVAKLTLELFGRLDNVFSWFVSQAGCSSTFFLGIKRHPSLKHTFWKTLLSIIKGKQVEFFTKHFWSAFPDKMECVEASSLLIEEIADSEIVQKLVDVGVIQNWLDFVISQPQDNIQAQVISFRFVGQLMLFMPAFIEKNQNSLQVFNRNWPRKSLPAFAILFNEVMVILEKLGRESSSMASKMYFCITLIAKSIGAGDKRDYLVDNFLPTVYKFPTIPAEYLIQHLRQTPLSNAEFLLACQSIQTNQNISTLLSIGSIVRSLLFENPLLNFYLSPLLIQIMQKVIGREEGVDFVGKVIDEAVKDYAAFEIKFKSRPKHQAISFGKKDDSQKGSSELQGQVAIKQKTKNILLAFLLRSITLVATRNDQSLKNSVKAKLLNAEANIKYHSFNVGCKALQDVLIKKFSISKEQQNEFYKEYSKKASAQLSDSAIRSHIKSNAQVALTSRLKGPDNLTKQFQQMSEKRRLEEEQKKAQQLKRKALEQKKRLSVRKELEITNLLRGQIGQAQIRDEGYLQRLIQQPKQIEVVPPCEMEERELEATATILKKYHRVLRHLFLAYTWTIYNGNSNQRFEDNQQRKEILTIAQLFKLLKDYRLSFLTSQTEISSLVRDINLKLLLKRELSELDFAGFEHFIIQYCALIMTKSHTITISSAFGNNVADNNFKNEPLHVLVSQFFTYLRSVFADKGEKLTMFEEESDANVTKEQAEQIQSYTKKLESRPDYILPKGYKKIIENRVSFNHVISQHISGLSEAFIAVTEILDEIFSKETFKFHTLESISQKKTISKVKVSSLGNPAAIQKERALSTYIQKKSPSISKDKNRRSSTRGILAGLQKLPATQRTLGQQAAAALGDIIDKVEAEKYKEKVRQRKFRSMTKLQEIQKKNMETQQKKIKEEQQQKQVQLQKKKDQQQKRREKTLKFLDEQRIKLAEKRKKQEQEQLKKAEEEEVRQAKKRENKEKFKVFHNNQVQKIKKIEESVLQKIRKERQKLEESKEQKEQERRKLKEQISQQDRRIIELRKQSEARIQAFYESEPIRNVFTSFQPNLKAVYDFLIQNTYVSLTEKKHNNQIIFEAWKQFLTSFQLTAIVHPKDISSVFKSLTKGKLASKEYHIGLNYTQFQQALLRIAIKYKAVFNLISEKIKDSVSESSMEANKEQKGKKEEINEFSSMKENAIKDAIKENLIKDSLEQYGNLSEVTDRTLLAVIYYLKVPKSKQGQEKRFREIVAVKHPSFTHPAERLKEKLNEEYTLQEPKKISQVKAPQSSVAPLNSSK